MGVAVFEEEWDGSKRPLFKTVIRAAVEYCSVIYHSLIPTYMADRLESVQKQAARIIFGRNMDYDGVISSGRLERLEDRRKEACLKFAIKAQQSDRFGLRWFPRNGAERTARDSTRRIYQERACRTERDRNNPLQYMIRLLNDQEQKSND